MSSNATDVDHYQVLLMPRTRLDSTSSSELKMWLSKVLLSDIIPKRCSTDMTSGIKGSLRK